MYKLLIFVYFLLFLLLKLDAAGIAKLIPIKGIPVIHSERDIQVTSPYDLKMKDKISTGKDVKAKVILNDGSKIVISENSYMSFHKNFIRLKIGKSTFIMTKSSKKFKVFTPVVLVGVYGTEFIITVQDNGDSQVNLIEGKIKVTALKGNKKSFFLKPSQTIRATISGLGIAFGKKEKNPGNLIQDKSESDKPEESAQEIVLDNFETNGDKFCIFSTARNNRQNESFYHSWLIKVNDYNTHNGKRLLFTGKAKGAIRGLEPGFYDFTFIICGSDYTFSKEISEQESSTYIKVLLEKFKFTIKIGTMDYVKQNFEIQKHVKIFITNGKKRSRVYFERMDNQKHPGYNVGLTKGRFLYLYYPFEINPPEKFEFFYDGEVPTTTKKITVIPDGQNFEYDVKF